MPAPTGHRSTPLRRLPVFILAMVLSGLTSPAAADGASALSGTASGVFSGSAPSTAALTAATPGSAQVVRQRPCPDSRFTCITLRLPRDHFAAPGGPTFDITFGLLRASSGHRKGVFVTVTGGPGTSGLASADSYTDAIDPRIPQQDDIVFFDQRGIGLSEPLQCPNAALAFYSTPAVPTLGMAEALAYAGAAKTFASDCVAETGEDPANLPYFSTAQAVEDLDAFRAYLNADTIDLYGESYGTQFAQQYAVAHPDRVHSLMLDGPVDLTLAGTQYYAEDARAFESTLTMTLDTCTGDTTCRRNTAGHDARATYDALAAQLRSGPLAYSFVAANGSVHQRAFGLGDLETAAVGFVYSTYDRMLLDRAVAQASRGQLLPLARLTYLSLGQDPETLAAIPDPGYSDAMYYAVECMDYDYGTGSPDQRALDYLMAGIAAGVASVRLGSVFYGDLPCAYWPAHPATNARPGYLTSTPFPVFVLASSTDPATPYAGALRIFDHLTNGYLIVEPGGPHVIFGRGNECEDAAVTAFLVRGVLPGQRETFCPYVGVEPYVGIPAAAVSEYRSGYGTGHGGALAAAGAIDDEINNNPDYWYRDGASTLQFGCLYGGWVRYVPYADGYRVGLHSCAFSAGLALTGTATIDTTNGTFSFFASARGGSAGGRTNLVYSRDANGHRAVSGTFLGRRVSQHN